MATNVKGILEFIGKARKFLTNKRFENWLIFTVLVWVMFFMAPVHAGEAYDHWISTSEGEATIRGCDLGGGSWIPVTEESDPNFPGYCSLADFKYKPLDVYREQMTVDEAIYGTPHSSQTQLSNAILGIGNVGVTALIGTNHVEGAENLAGSNVSVLSRKGLLSVVNEGIYSTSFFGGNINTTQHLAENWVPGYKENNKAVAATTALTPPYGYNYLIAIGLSEVWTRVLVISYVIFVVIFIVAGFMIMFRSKIGGQVAVTVYNTLPQIIFSLVLATFSFAIVGFILNISVIMTKFILEFMGLSPVAAYVRRTSTSFPRAVIPRGPLFLLDVRRANTYGTAMGSITKSLRSVLDTSGIVNAGWAGFLKAIGVSVQALLGAIPGVIVFVVLLVAYLVMSVKVYISVLKALGGIMLDLAVAPIIMVASAIPGQNSMRKKWINRILKNSLTFPVTIALLNAPRYLFEIMGGVLKLDIRPLVEGDWSVGVQDTGLMIYMVGMIFPLVCYSAAANVPVLLTDFFPSKASEGFQKAQQGIQQEISKVPILGNFIGAK